MISYASFQLLVAAIERSSKSSFADALKTKVFDPLNMKKSGLLGQGKPGVFIDAGLNKSHIGGPAYVFDLNISSMSRSIWADRI